jgi:ubiquinone/menaquinone biosynthesis C-methylase UbiE
MARKKEKIGVLENVSMEEKQMNDGMHHGPGQHAHGQGRGPSSFRLLDPEAAFEALGLKAGERVLDLGCGPGDYSLRAARDVGQSGRVWALDKWAYLVDGVRAEAERNGLRNITAMVADITEPLPIDTGSIDLCLLGTVLHSMGLSRAGETLFGEVRRVLTPHGLAAVIEFKKEEQPFGPPEHLRMSPGDVQRAMAPHGFRRRQLTDLGYAYLIQLGTIV